VLASAPLILNRHWVRGPLGRWWIRRPEQQTFDRSSMSDGPRPHLRMS